MGAEKNNTNEGLSRIIADLAAKANVTGASSAHVDRLREELKKATLSDDTVFGKLRGLVESFRDIIPDEKQRYHAAVAALSKTEKLGREDIIGALNAQLAELKILEKGLLSALPGWRDELKVMEDKTREIRDEVAGLRERIGQLENEEKILLKNIAAREKEMEPVEKSVGELFTTIGAEIAGFRQKIEESNAVSAVPQPAPSGDSLFPGMGGGGQNNETEGSPAPRELSDPSVDPLMGDQSVLSGGSIFPDEKPNSADLEATAPRNAAGQKKCPMCGGRMDFNLGENVWMCYSCAYEEKGEPPRDQAPGNSGPGKPSAPHEGIGSSVQQPDTTLSKKCPMCGGRMDFNLGENVWMCYSCAYEEKGEPPQGRSPVNGGPGDPSAPREGIGSSAPLATSTDSKKCPMCGGRMDYNFGENLWMCYSCAYEEKGEAAASKPSAPPLTVPLADMMTKDSLKKPRRFSPFKSQPSVKKKTCPSCGKSMIWYEEEKTWRCSSCEYERRI
jgi:ribosomal protein L37AE/L43A